MKNRRVPKMRGIEKEKKKKKVPQRDLFGQGYGREQKIKLIE